MKSFKTLAALGAATMLSACASILSGTEQNIHVNSNPEGANCALARPVARDSAPIQFSRVNPTPGEVTLSKTKYDITVSCSKPGYVDGVALLESDTDATTFGNLIFGGLIGWGIDSARGADNKYDSAVNVPLVSLTPEATIAPAAPIAAPVVAAPLAAPTAARAVKTKYPKVAPESAPQEAPVTGYIAPVPWYKGPAPKPRAPEATSPQTMSDAAAVAPAKAPFQTVKK